MAENGKENLLQAFKLVAHVDSLVGTTKSVKCILDMDGNYEMTSNGLKYLQAIQSEDWVYEVIYEECYNFHSKYGFGSEDYLSFVGKWCCCFVELLNQGIPIQIIEAVIFETLDYCIEQLPRFAFDMKVITDISRITQSVEKLCETQNYADKNAEQLLKEVSKLSLRSENIPVKHERTSFISSDILRTSISSSNRKLYSRYSRHNINDMKTENDLEKHHFMEMNFVKFCLLASNIDDEVVQNIISKLAKNFYNDFVSQCNLSLADIPCLKFNPDNIIIECVSSGLVQSDVFNGILVTCHDKFYVDLLQKYNGKCVNMVLINTIAYGNSLSKEGSTKIKEEISFSELNNFNSVCDNHPDIYKKLETLNIKLIVHRGEIGVIEQTQLYSRGIVCLCERSYKKLCQLSHYLSCPMKFDLQNISVSDIAIIRLETISPLCLHPTADTKYIKKDQVIECYVTIQSIEKSSQTDHPYYSVLMHSRGNDLRNLKFEMLSDAVNRIKQILKVGYIIQSNGQLEKNAYDIIKNMKWDELNKRESNFPSYISRQVLPFWSLIFASASDVFEKYQNRFVMSRPGIESLNFRTFLWKESFLCVSRIAKSRKIQADE